MRDVLRPMKKLAKAPAQRESASAAAVNPADTLTGSRTAVDATVSVLLAKAGMRFISHGVDTGMERNPRA